MDRSVLLYQEALNFKLQNPAATLRECLTAVHFSKSSFYQCRSAVELTLIDEERYTRLQDGLSSITELNATCKTVLKTTLSAIYHQKKSDGVMLPLVPLIFSMCRNTT